MDALDGMFLLGTVLACAATLGLLAHALITAAPSSSAEERRFRPFRRIRIGTYVVLVLVSVSLIAGRQAQHRGAATPVDADAALVLLQLAVTLVRGRRRNPRAPPRPARACA